MWNRLERPWRMARAPMAWTWGLLTLLVLGFAPQAQAGDAWVPIDTGQWDVSTIAIDPASPGTVYMGGFSRTSQGPAVFKSADGGTSWSSLEVQTTGERLFMRITGLAVDPAAPGTLYATGSKLGAYLGDSGVYKSSDGGASWAEINFGSGAFRPTASAMAIEPTTPATIYAGLYAEGLYKSMNGGATWTAINSGLPNSSYGTKPTARALAIDPTKPGTVYAAIGDSVYKTTNGGASWALSATDAGNSITALVLDPATPGTLYAATESDVSSGGVFKTTDGGATWVQADAGLPHRGAIRALVLDPTAPGTVYASAVINATINATGDRLTKTDGGVFKTTDGGASWAAVGTRLTGTPVVALALNPATRTLFAGASGGVFKHVTDGNLALLPDSGLPMTLPLPGGGSIEARSRHPGTQVQLVETPSGATVAMVTTGSALLQHSKAGQPLAGLLRSGGMAVLTPSCTAAQVLVTATGDTHTAVAQGCALALTGAGDALPTPGQGLSIPQGTVRAENVQMHVTGPLTQRSMLVHLNLAALPSGADHVNVYLLALVPGPLVGSVESALLERLPTGGWGLVNGPMTALTSTATTAGPNAQVVVEIIKDGDLSGLVGTELYIGYGTNYEEMQQAGRYRALYRNE